MKLKLACADFSFPLMPRKHVLDLIALLDLQGVDIGLFERSIQFNLSKELANVSKNAVELKKQIHGRGLVLADLFLAPGIDFFALALNHPEARVRRKSRNIFERGLEYTVRSVGSRMTCLPGVHWKSESYDCSLKRCSDELAWRLEQAKAVGIIVSIEPHLGSLVSTPDKVRRLLGMTPGLTLTLDYGHFVSQGIHNSSIRPLLDYASHFHARCGRKSRLQAAFKDNTIPFPQILHVMKANGYRGFVGIEYVWVEWNHCNEVDNISETILLRDHLRSVQM